jgi:hypothetical protein
MNFHQSQKTKRSLGALRRASKTKTLSPDLTGPMRLQRHTLDSLVKQFDETDQNELICNLAAWRNQDSNGPYLSVELSPRYVSRKPIEQPCPFEFMFDDNQEENQH